MAARVVKNRDVALHGFDPAERRELSVLRPETLVLHVW
jgi:hypothetical protein